MAQLAAVYPHLTPAELAQRFRRCRYAMEKTHWQAIWLRAQGQPTAALAQLCGYQQDWVLRLVRRYNAHGPAVVVDGRKRNGRAALLSPSEL